MDVIQWYPGHMAKAKKIIKEHLQVVDLVVEMADARVPAASRNPDLADLIERKQTVLVFNKADLADPTATRKWLSYYEAQGLPGIAITSHKKEGVKTLVKWLQEQLKAIKDKKKEKGRLNYLPKIMVVGIPNVGKSSLINSLGGKASAKTGDKPGVTKGHQWINLKNFNLLDVPGVLWPKFANQEIGYRLAATGAIGDHVLNIEETVNWLIDFLKKNYQQQLINRYRLDINQFSANLPDLPNEQLLSLIGHKRGCLVSGGQVDYLKAAEIVLREFRQGKIGQITLEKPE